MNVLLCATFLAAALAYYGDSDEGIRPGKIDLFEDCEIQSTSEFRERFPQGDTGSETACLFFSPDNRKRGGRCNSNNQFYCYTETGFFRGTDNEGDNEKCTTPNSESKRNVLEVRDVHKYTVPFQYLRSDEDINDGQLSCAPEIRVSIDGEVVAHTDGRYVEGGQTWPASGEGVFRFKVSLARGIGQNAVFEYRDGPDCDQFDDDDSAESADWETFDPLDDCSEFDKKRDVESSSSSSSSSSSGTTVSVSGVKEERRFFCVALSDAVLVEIEESSSSSSSSSSSK
jgi:hypothetical protein